MSAYVRNSYSNILHEDVVHPECNPKLDEYLKN